MKLKKVLKGFKEIEFAYCLGSILDKEAFNDIDKALYIRDKTIRGFEALFKGGEGVGKGDKAEKEYRCKDSYSRTNSISI